MAELQLLGDPAVVSAALVVMRLTQRIERRIAEVTAFSTEDDDPKDPETWFSVRVGRLLAEGGSHEWAEFKGGAGAFWGYSVGEVVAAMRRDLGIGGKLEPLTFELSERESSHASRASTG